MWCECIRKMFDFHAIRSAGYRQDVETGLFADAVVPDIMVGGGEKVPLLGCAHKAFRFTVTVVFSGLDFAKNNKFLVFRNYVHLQMAVLPVAGQNMVIVLNQVAYSLFLPLETDGAV